MPMTVWALQERSGPVELWRTDNLNGMPITVYQVRREITEKRAAVDAYVAQVEIAAVQDIGRKPRG